jgi:hypothetical protein
MESLRFQKLCTNKVIWIWVRIRFANPDPDPGFECVLDCGTGQYADILLPLALKLDSSPSCDTPGLEYETSFTEDDLQQRENLTSPATGLVYTKWRRNIMVHFQMEKFMKIEQVEAYSGIIGIENVGNLYCIN